jgi:hypothetical protein
VPPISATLVRSRTETRLRPLLLAVGAIAVVLGVLTAAGWPAERYRHGDFVQYWIAGHALLETVDPYDPATWRALHERFDSQGHEIIAGFGFFYPPHVAVAALPFALLPIGLAAPLWFVAQTGSAAAALFALGRRLFIVRPRRDLVLLAALVVILQPAYVLAGDGNVTRFLVGIIGGGLALLLAGLPLAAGAVFGFAAVKPQLFFVFAPALLLFTDARDRARLVFGATASAGALVVAALMLQPDWLGRWVEQATRLQGTYGRTSLWGLFAAEERWIAVVVAVAALAILLAWWRIRRPALPVAAAAALALSLFLAPYAVPYDQAVLLVGVVVLIAMIAEFPAAARAVSIGLLLCTGSTLGLVSAAGLITPGPELVLPAPALYVLVLVADGARAWFTRRGSLSAPAS